LVRTVAAMTHVRCYAGATAPERPVALVWEGEERAVAEILSRWRTPEALGFRVRTADGMVFDLIYDLRWDRWSVTPRALLREG